MAIDPIATTGGAAAKMPADTDVSAQSNTAAGGSAQKFDAAMQSGESVNITDYASRQSGQGLPLNALSADGQAKHFANPTTLGEEVLNYLEGFHERVSGGASLAERLAVPNTAAATPVSTGPASILPTASPPAGLNGAEKVTNSEFRFEAVLDVMKEVGFRHTETNLVSNVGQQFSKAMNTLMRGQ